MARIEFGCNKCGAAIVTRSVAEALAWDKSHDAECIPRDPFFMGAGTPDPDYSNDRGGVA